jgi:hypothetical protein
MSVEELESAITKLPREEFSRLAAWFADYQAASWEREIEADLRAGRLDHVIQRARDDIASGKSKPL